MNDSDPGGAFDGMTRKQLLRASGLVGLGAAAGAPSPTLAAGRRTREYWIAAVPVTWNVVPNGQDAIEKQQFAREQTTFRAVAYRRFTRGWRQPLRLAGADRGQQLGLSGPLIRGRVGDRILVHFKNMDTEYNRPHSMHFHGVHYEFASDGSFIPGFSGRGANVKPGQSLTYELEAGPDSAGVWPYHDHSPSMHASIVGGLYGSMSILGRRQPAPDREFVVFFAHHLGFMTINGRAFVGNTPNFHARVGQSVQWDVLALGDDFHTFHIHGHRWRRPDGTAEDTRTIGPAESFAVGFREDRPGRWLYHCHVESHMAQGMIGLYHVVR